MFSINDTIAWWTEGNVRLEGHAEDTVRLFPVAGMGHCMGGPATNRFDAFGTIVCKAALGRCRLKRTRMLWRLSSSVLFQPAS